MERLIVDEASGELIDKIYEGDRILRKGSIERGEKIQEWRLKNFFKGHIGEVKKWMKELTPAEKAILFTVGPYVGYKDCCLKYADGHDFRFDDIVELSGLSRGSVSETINSLRKKDILYKGQNSDGIQYFMNPWLFCKGAEINNVLQTMFENYRIRVFGGMKWGEYTGHMKQEYNFKSRH